LKRVPTHTKESQSQFLGPADFFKNNISLPGAFNKNSKSSKIQKRKYQLDLPKCIPMKESELSTATKNKC
jgi:hypothetical protein